jgi:hypothetical protein
MLLLAIGLARREWRLYRTTNDMGSDLFLYTRGRLARRMGGVLVLAALAATFAALGLRPARNAHEASAYLGLIMGELLLLIGMSVWDLIETARSAKPEDLTRQGTGPTRTRRKPPSPR